MSEIKPTPLTVFGSKPKTKPESQPVVPVVTFSPANRPARKAKRSVKASRVVQAPIPTTVPTAAELEDRRQDIVGQLSLEFIASIPETTRDMVTNPVTVSSEGDLRRLDSRLATVRKEWIRAQ